MTATESTKEIFNGELGKFIDQSPTPFHAVSSISEMLTESGFTALSEAKEWSLQSGGKYFVTRNGSSLIAFVVGTDGLAETGIRMAGAHTDSPCLMVKPQPELLNNQYYFSNIQSLVLC